MSVIGKLTSMVTVLGGLALTLGCSNAEEAAVNVSDSSPAAVATSTPASSSRLTDLCGILAREGWIESDAAILSAYQTTASQVTKWESGSAGTDVGGTSNFAKLAPGQIVAVCYVSGSFPAPQPPPPAGSTEAPPMDRAIFLVPQGGDVTPPVIYGYADKLTESDGPLPVTN